MSRFQKIIGVGLASAMMLTTPAFAATAATAPTTKTTVAAKQAPATKAAPAKHVAVAKAKHHTRRSGKHFASATLKNGKKVTYNCNLAGNKHKTACKS